MSSAPSWTLVVGDCREAMASMVAESVDAVVTDPPYHLTSVSRGGSPRKPGSGPFGRVHVGERGFMGKKWDGGGISFDPATWEACFRVLKPGGRLLAFAGSRTAHRIWCAIEDAGFTIEDTILWLYGSGFPKHRSKLKPAYEPVCVARKGPVSALQIDACRIGFGEGGDRDGEASANCRYAERGATGFAPLPGPRGGDAAGRWPANVILDDAAAEALDDQTGILGASRFFYTAKADRAERNHGLEGAPKRSGGSNAKGFTADVERGQDRNRPTANHHPTVKPVDLMRWLCRLVTPPGGTVLDPFMGSGTTGVACTLDGFHFIGCEIDPEYAEIARRRIGATQPGLPLDA